ncbi:GNAT family N-acetyltransferase [Actinospica durhamensis]|uniref:GNAT family N-acetyltransferase n=1 Tax=Actinospica durhamensis TaxID=1508375 RepID=A0A941ELR1_9ACTN|nr:GNAT family N-acetyltransferase [Actinospica durhamensis]MBR7834740.1 GNAT family N-acetyltransferase [Actinospica durhamensis]
MSTDALVPRARELWEGLAAARVTFGPAGTVNVGVSPASSMCPPGWVGLVILGGSAIVTAPDDAAAARVRAAFAEVPADTLTDADVVRTLLPVVDILGPTALGYLSAADFRPVDALSAAPADADRPAAAIRIEQLPVGHPDLCALEEAAGEQDAAEASIDEITSPVFVVREGEVVMAACGYQAWPSRTAHVCVLTHPDWRGRGLARATASATVAHALAEGLLPQWRARVPPSRRVARTLGFREIGTQISIELGD